jgi:AraC-like DNA-binding protein
MPSIPLPFVVSLLLAITAIRMARVGERDMADRGLLIFVAAIAVQSVVVGLRWHYDWQAARLLQPVLAAAIPPLAWRGFSGLRRKEPATLSIYWPVIASVAAAAISAYLMPPALDFLLVGLFVGAGAAMLWSALRRGGEFVTVRLGSERTTRHAMTIAAGLLILSGAIDATVALQLEFGRDADARSIVTAANLAMLLLVALAAALADAGKPADLAETEQPPLPKLGPIDHAEEDDSEDHALAVVAAFDDLMRKRSLYRDPDLTLARIARRAGIPARQISAAVNRIHGRNVSQIVNEYRVAEARRLLRETNDTITMVMLESGFQTKSNFNREFLRVAGMTPSAYRGARP